MNEDSELQRKIRAAELDYRNTVSTLRSYEARIGEHEKTFEEKEPEYKELRRLRGLWKTELEYYKRLLVDLRKSTDTPTDAPVVVPVAKEVPAKAETPFQAWSNGVDLAKLRANWRYKAISWRIDNYPLPISYRTRSGLFQRALRSVIRMQPSYSKWLDSGGVSMTQNDLRMDDLYGAAAVVGVDTEALRREVDTIHAEISAFGQKGIDKTW